MRQDNPNSRNAIVATRLLREAVATLSLGDQESVLRWLGDLNPHHLAEADLVAFIGGPFLEKLRPEVMAELKRWASAYLRRQEREEIPEIPTRDAADDVRTLFLRRYKLALHRALDEYGMDQTVESADVRMMIDRDASIMAMEVAHYLTLGEDHVETKYINVSFETKQFAKWVDHLKFTLRACFGKWWAIPDWMEKHLTPNYVESVEVKRVNVPVSIVRVCPHSNIPWGDKETQHLAWLSPREHAFAEAKLREEYEDMLRRYRAGIGDLKKFVRS